MEKTSLNYMIDDNKFNITVSQKGLDTNLHINKETGIRTISAHGINLAYDPIKFKEDPATYIAEQINNHQNYHKLIKKELMDSYKSFNDIISRENDLERMLGFVSEDTVKTIFSICKLIATPITWLKFQTLEGKHKKAIEWGELDADGYRATEVIINYGEHFIKERLNQSNIQLPETIKNSLVKWEKVQKKLSYSYSKLVNTADKKVEARQRKYDRIFPNHQNS